MKRVIFKNDDNSIGIIAPSQEALDRFGIEAIAKKDCPEGLPFWIVDQTEIPTDREFRDAWEADEELLGEPHGYGHKEHTFEGVGR